ncbi:EF-hand domain-containing protein [Thiorhodovibrio winogradskyi]|nr:EF-hand domain-containing protein [Thiorhodovibrio winogradskyi]
MHRPTFTKPLMRVTLITFLLGFSALALAQMGQGGGGMQGGRGAGRMMPSFSDFDADGDGQITQEEFEQARAERIAERSSQGYQMRGLADAPSFADLDTNGDGTLDEKEFATGAAKRHGQPRP